MTYAVFFDVLPKKGFTDAYFGMASGLKPIVEQVSGFLSVERFENLGQPGWYLSLSQWQDEKALGSWRCQHDHHEAQVCGRNLVLEDYRLRVAKEQQAESEKSSILAVVGDFAEIENAVTKLAKNHSDIARLFKGVINPARGVALIDCDFDDASKLKHSLVLSQSTQVGVYEVQRDYGMFDRAQAPSVFA